MKSLLQCRGSCTLIRGNFGDRNYLIYIRILASINYDHPVSDEFDFENILNVFQTGRTTLDDYSYPLLENTCSTEKNT